MIRHAEAFALQHALSALATLSSGVFLRLLLRRAGCFRREGGSSGFSICCLFDLLFFPLLPSLLSFAQFLGLCGLLRGFGRLLPPLRFSRLLVLLLLALPFALRLSLRVERLVSHCTLDLLHSGGEVELFAQRLVLHGAPGGLSFLLLA